MPIKAKAEINLGVDKLVVFLRRKVRTRRFNFVFRRDSHGREWVIGWDEEQKWTDEIRNYRKKPVHLELRRVYKGDVEFESELKTTIFNYETIEAKLVVPPGKTGEYPHTVTIHYGTNAKQTRVRLR